jgi:hypothetical protein
MLGKISITELHPQSSVESFLYSALAAGTHSQNMIILFLVFIFWQYWGFELRALLLGSLPFYHLPFPTLTLRLIINRMPSMC